MKKLLSAITLLCLATWAQAQTPGLYTLMNAGTNSVLATATNVYASTNVSPLAVSEYENIGLQIDGKPNTTAVAGSVATFRFARTGDTSTYETTPAISIQLPLGTGTTNTTIFTNISIPGVGAIRLIDIWNTNAVAITNLQIKARLKRTSVSAR